MSKTLQGKVVSNKMQNTVVVEVFRRVPHPLYKKLLKKSKKFKVETKGEKFEIGQTVKIIETSPISKDKHFAILTTGKSTEQAENIKKPSKLKKEKKV
jgi:small subunit ribosomal protein S17